jgi:hypothetical protein
MIATPQLPGMPPEDAATRVARACWAAVMAARQGNPAYKLTEDALLAALRPALAKEMPKKARAVNGRNVLFDAIAAGFGHNGKITRAAAGTIGKALAEIREVDPTVTAEDLERGCRYVRKKFDNCGPMAVAAHWHEIATQRTERTRTAKMDIYQEPPTGWREVARKRYPDAADWGNPCDFATVAWFDVSPLLRPEILKLIP